MTQEIQISVSINETWLCLFMVWAEWNPLLVMGLEFEYLSLSSSLPLPNLDSRGDGPSHIYWALFPSAGEKVLWGHAARSSQ